ncbi:bifunctional diguanylate cyclase/phosphodiesterase [Eubacterium maltosivorans]|uniref:GGDEF domain-containing protein n=1 Tax=Eubacterium maltosivorans TaxID=2041044 RepID=A0A2A5T9X0_EUBML|nr:EAL domain-containing protein [Eubacterium maltosivorans]QCT70675.1 GGDEF domain-containing protein [Eubacterium maltosivorans]
MNDRGLKSRVWRPILAASLLIFIIVIIAYVYTSYLDHFLESETQTTLKELSQQSATTIQNRLRGDFNTLDAIATYIGNASPDNILGTLPVLDQENNRNSFKRMGIITPDGVAHTTDGYDEDFSDRDYFYKALGGKTVVSGILTDKFGGEPITVYAAPIRSNDKILGVLFATNAISQYSKVLSVTSFNGKGYSYIINDNGDIIIRSNHPGSNQNIENITELSYSNDKTRSQVIKALEARETCVGEYHYNGELYYFSIAPVDTNNWNVLIVAPKSVVSEKSSQIIQSTLLTWGIILFFFTALIVYIEIHQRKSRRELKRMAYTDDITGFSNFNKFVLDSEHWLGGKKELQYAIVSFDIDKFKAINDLYGFQSGNQLLAAMSETIASFLDDKETFCRVASDDFALLLHYKTIGDLSGRLEALRGHLACLDFDIPFTLSFGIYLVQEDHLTVNHMYDRADMARKSIKGANGNGIAYFDTVMRNQILRERKIENQMDEALASNQFKVYLQPKYSLKTLQPVGAEALVRWLHPEKGLIPPAEFIPLFEKNNFVIKLDFFMFESICKQQRMWMDQGLSPLLISVNFSRKHLSHSDFAENLMAVVKKYDVPPDCLELEVTESAVFDNIDVLASVFKALNDFGVKISIDDFGTGYSSLNLLKELPVDVLKMDKEFFNETTLSRRGEKVVESVIQMAHSLDIKVVAEGVETQDQIDFLKKIGCDIIQGYYFAKAMPVEDFACLVYSVQ